MRIALKFAYNGMKFQWYARQPKLKTVEGEIIDLLIQYNIIKNVKKSKFRSASRTDKGVSALGNVIAFDTNLTKNLVFKKIKNNKKDILFYGIKNVEPDFYPRYAKFRVYSYYLKKRDFDFDKIIDITSVFIGGHNFSNYAKLESDKNPIRKIENIILTKQDNYLIFDFYAQTFLWHQIRRIVSAIEKYGNEKLKKEQINEALNNPNKKVDFGLAPAEPLILKDVVYNFEFEYDKKQLNKLTYLKRDIVSCIFSFKQYT